MYTYRNHVVANLNHQLQEVEEVEDDIEILVKWFRFRCHARWWQQFKAQHTTKDAAQWIIENAVRELEESDSEKSFQKAANAPSETELEDCLHQMEAIQWQGSEKQIKWAKDIATQNLATISVAFRKNNNLKLPTSAKLWIENRNILLAKSIDV